MLWIGGLPSLVRSFAGTASLVRMVSVIMVDIAPFMTILGTVVIGSALVFTINSPFDAEFGFLFDDDRVEPSHPLLTVFQMALNMGTGQSLDHSTPWPTLITILFFMGFVVVVLCVLVTTQFFKSDSRTIGLPFQLLHARYARPARNVNGSALQAEHADCHYGRLV
eukprot:SAG11_NODE_60_length_19094_cov_26.549566_8_plen_166_part_00